MKAKKKHNYLNNRDILKEIHKSKKTYCVYRDIELDSDFDIILSSYDEIFKTRNVVIGKDTHGNDIFADVPVITLAKQNKAARLQKAAYDAAIKQGLKVKQAEFAIDPESYTDSDVVLRVTMWDHVPIAPPKKKAPVPKKRKIIKSKLIIEEIDEAPEPPPIKHIKVNFPPFYHYRLDAVGVPVQIAKSHWKGAYDGGQFNGEFNKEHGRMTEKLAMMFMKLCERYATRSNWRGYTYNDEMRGQALLQLSQIGLQFDESKSQNPFAYYTAAITNSFTRVLNIEKRNQAIRDDILEANNIAPSYTRQNENDAANDKNMPVFNHNLYKKKPGAKKKETK